MKNKNAMIQRARRLVKGLIIEWTDTDPLKEEDTVLPGSVSHKNPMIRPSARKIFQDYQDWIVGRQPFLWLVTITTHFLYDNGVEDRWTTELEAFTTISKINEHALAEIEADFRRGDPSKYTHTAFRIECIGINPKREDKTNVAQA